MAAEDILAVGTAAEASAPAPSVEKGLGRDEFLRMLIVQLENQDPMNPQDPTEFVAQLAQFSSLEQLLFIRDGIDDLADAQLALDELPAIREALEELAGVDGSSGGMLAASALIGRDVVADAGRVELDGQALPELTFDLGQEVSGASLVVRDPSGDVVREVSLEGVGPAGRYQLTDWDPGQDGPLAPGVYSFEVQAANSFGLVPVPTYVTGRVTGATTSPYSADAMLLVGAVGVPTRDLVEVRDSGAGA